MPFFKVGGSLSKIPIFAADKNIQDLLKNGDILILEKEGEVFHVHLKDGYIFLHKLAPFGFYQKIGFLSKIVIWQQIQGKNWKFVANCLWKRGRGFPWSFYKDRFLHACVCKVFGTMTILFTTFNHTFIFLPAGTLKIMLPLNFSCWLSW